MHIEQHVEIGLPLERRRQCGNAGAADVLDIARAEQFDRAQKSQALFRRDRKAITAQQCDEIQQRPGRARQS